LALHSFPTRRSSDLVHRKEIDIPSPVLAILPQHHVAAGEEKPHVPVAYLRAALYERDAAGPHIGLQLVTLHAQGKVRLRTFGQGDRKSTRLNSSHVS